MSTFLLTWLSKQYGPLDPTVFAREQPGEWLVLEPSPGGPSRATEPIAARVALRRDRAGYVLGRDPGSDFVIGAPGVAPSHVVLEAVDGAWTIRRGDPGADTTLDGLPLGDVPMTLGSGARIVLGGVSLTYYDGEGFHARLRASPPDREK